MRWGSSWDLVHEGFMYLKRKRAFGMYVNIWMWREVGRRMTIQKISSDFFYVSSAWSSRWI